MLCGRYSGMHDSHYMQLLFFRYFKGNQQTNSLLCGESSSNLRKFAANNLYIYRN
jgi:hypothetical protein